MSIQRVALVLAVSMVLAPCGLRRAESAPNKSIGLKFLGRHSSGIFGPDAGGSESLAHDPGTQRFFVTNVAERKIDVIDVLNPLAPVKLFSIDLKPYGKHANSLAVRDGIVAAAVENPVQTSPGKVVFFDTDGKYLSAVTAGALPDMITFTPNGRKVLVANEGQPSDDYSIDPEGSVSIIDMTKGAANLTQSDATTADFKAFNKVVLDPSIRIFGPKATVAQDLEPEYITVSHDSSEAWVTLQENNAIAHLDLTQGKFTRLMGLGFKDHIQPGNALDASDRDNAINIRNWPVKGMYQPDGIASYQYQGQTYLITANEGDSRDYAGFSEEARVSSLTLDPIAFPDATLKQNANLGRLTVTNTLGKNASGKYEAIYVFGARSFSIWTTDGVQVFDSGDQLEQIVAERFPQNFNANNEANDFDSRSDNKGPEPEDVVIARAFGRVYAFITLERIGGVMIYDVTDPRAVSFVAYVNSRDFTVPVCDEANDGNCEQGSVPNPAVGDLGPEIVQFISAENSPIGKPLLALANEISGTTSLFEVVKK